MPEPPVGGARPRIVLVRVDAVVAVLAAAVEVALVAEHVLAAVEEVPHAADVAGRIVGARRIVVDVGRRPFRHREPLAARERELDEGDQAPGARLPARCGGRTRPSPRPSSPPSAGSRKGPPRRCRPSRRRVSCLAAERCWDQARWAITAYAWRFDGLERAPRTGEAA